MSYLSIGKEVVNNFLPTSTLALPLSTTILVVDDHALMRSAIGQALSLHPEVNLVLTARDYAGAEDQAAQRQPDLIWLDLHTGQGDGIAEIRHLRQLLPDACIMALADEEDEQEAFEAIMAGAQGYCSKQDIDSDEITNINSMLCRGEFVLHPKLLTRLMQRLRAAAMPLWGSEYGADSRSPVGSSQFNRLTQLTSREREIMQLISQGFRDRDIAEGLHISEKTVQKHVQSILSKLGAHNRTEAAYFIHRQRTVS